MRHLEDKIQEAIASHLRLRGVPGLVWWHTANGGKRNAREAARLKKHGVRAGVSDLVLFYAGNLFALELKAPGNRPTVSQLEFLSDVDKQGGYTAWVEGLDRALACLKSWGLVK